MEKIILRQPLKTAVVTQVFGADFKIFINGKEVWFYKDKFGLLGHPGVDYRAGVVGTPVYSANDGVCLYAGFDNINGWLVQIWNEALGFKTLYGHNSEIKVKQGDVVKAGDLIALSGGTGEGTAPHLHFGMKMTGPGGNGLNNDNGYNGAIDPAPYIKLDYLGNNINDMIFKKEKTSPNIYLINEEFGTKIMIVDMPTLDAFHGHVEEVDSLSNYIPFGTMVWTERIIN